MDGCTEIPTPPISLVRLHGSGREQAAKSSSLVACGLLPQPCDDPRKGRPMRAGEEADPQAIGAILGGRCRDLFPLQHKLVSISSISASRSDRATTGLSRLRGHATVRPGRSRSVPSFPTLRG